MNNPLIPKGANIVSLFCRLNLHGKKNLPLRSSEMGLLIYTVKSHTPVTPVMAANYFKVSKPMIASMVKQLTNQNYVTKVPSLEDKRSYTLQPTPKAIKLTDSIYDEYFKDMRRLLNGMGVEKFTDMLILLEEANKLLLEEEHE
ncbi:MarR family winged helix-turn-helix transcriptional regulator [Enterococcus asini]|uniref:MarR family winged helix-turn-helix transcriptional regulator n=1 Tax=Enterococcus asini TaxID=57732 RepID=UPI000E52123F|nr:MarR family transcriptional regulator [Enterococcus asini]RGW14550.1 MarR family transcriptional regulator [Enterococcus asini]